MVIIVYRLKKDGEESNFLAVFFVTFKLLCFRAVILVAEIKLQILNHRYIW